MSSQRMQCFTNSLLQDSKKEKKGGVCLSGMLPSNITLEDQLFCAQTAHGARANIPFVSIFSTLVLDSDSPFKDRRLAYVLNIRSNKKTYQLVCLESAVSASLFLTHVSSPLTTTCSFDAGGKEVVSCASSCGRCSRPRYLTK